MLGHLALLTDWMLRKVLKKTLDPVYQIRRLSVSQLCNGDFHRPLRFECFDWDQGSAHDFIGAFETTVQDIMDNPTKGWEVGCG
jgi:Ca2+-dependent lipid-binding protein